MAAFTIVDVLDLLKTRGHSENTGLSQASPGYKYFTITDLFAQDYVMKHGEGNGNPLQYSCLENPMDGGGW